MTANSRHYYRKQAIARRRDPDQDRKYAEAFERLQARVNSMLEGNPVIEQAKAAARLTAPAVE